MKKHISYIFLFPALLVQHFTGFALWVIFFSTSNDFARFVMEEIFRGNAWYLIGSVYLFALSALVCGIIFSVYSVRKASGEMYLWLVTLTVKLVQIPAYGVIFIFSILALLLLSVWGTPIVIALFLINVFSILTSGIIGLAAVITSVKEKKLTVAAGILVAILQFVFVLDVITTIASFVYIKRKIKLQALDKAEAV